ncbi:hypothetical protein MATR_15800 [Marivirga tractuosa]|uniref:Uncharacterized protein n=1 Tax=Marivirga tractuosa (strain ATCC 23168 / DSM 4126 / NBRC 15989 / NCIMB 1408 / VKM B-1430 / H-43) TaxID=643867 RepID=E4TSH4_MARTH|nr:hypothetical protein [Marivirga tractuosa]ADR20794.1 hypothetical protein Ftrac_0792 [Marivirga tractuosa DSM 4126]BDD14755.1 hypothetical protein MATR_15800 [Marivirga tractuosa]
MKKDIDFSPVTGVELVITQSEKAGETQWDVYLINKNLIELETVMITSRGYGRIGSEEKETSVLRHMIEKVEEQSYARIEPIQPELFQLNNEYWVSYYILDQVFDKKFVFVPDSIKDENLQYIPELDLMGIRHA